MPWDRPYDDGIKNENTRSKLRAEAWRSTPDKHRKTPTERLCGECHKWFRFDEPAKWCAHLTQIPDTPADGPNVQVFTPYFNPNIQHGGAWVESRAAEKECMRRNNKEWKH